ncbi:hypothetical protein ACQP1P_33120 [Dactylosporangium sp. CA-052675]|uniref:hypothetical protein n=1 Tax=Dactylosporangium sp. CA-052675 TaxID=3239927 RepID=UPI003D8A0518
MLWPVLLNTHPREANWSLGERVTTRPRWLDDPEPPDDLVLHQVVVRASTLLDADGRPWAQLVQAGNLLAVRQGDDRRGELTLDGCLGFDGWLGLIGELPFTEGVVRRIRIMHDLYDRSTDGWIRRPGRVRLTEVPDTSPGRLCDGPSCIKALPAEGQPEPGTIQFVSPTQYFRMTRDQLPAQQWQTRGFLVDLEITSRGPRRCDERAEDGSRCGA